MKSHRIERHQHEPSASEQKNSSGMTSLSREWPVVALRKTEAITEQLTVCGVEDKNHVAGLLGEHGWRERQQCGALSPQWTRVTPIHGERTRSRRRAARCFRR